MVSTGLGRRPTRLAQWTDRAISRAGFLSAVARVPKLVPTRFQLAHVSLRAGVAIRRGGVGKIRHSTRLFRGQLVPFLAGNAGSTLANMRLRAISSQLCWGPRLAMRVALVMAVGAEKRALPIRRRHPDGLQAGVGPLHQGGDMPIILPVTTGLRRHDDVLLRLDQRLPLSALDDRMGRLPCGRCVIRDMTVPRLAPLAPLRVVHREKGRDAGRLPRYALALLMSRVRRRERRFDTCPCARLICWLMGRP
jgi:hypothetical protein